MKKLKYSKKIKDEVSAFAQLINNYCDKLNKENAKQIDQLIKSIAEGENLDYNVLKEKYLKNNSTTDDNNINNININSDEIINIDTESDSPTNVILDKIIIENISYYYEKTEGGRVFNSASKIVGTYKDDQIKLLTN
jgi:hypothetical protein